ncbi:MAG: helix-turn-helix transcriptional regulator [Hydrogenoanaerobacterium sp.]
MKYTYLANESGIPLNTLSAMLNCKRKISVEEYFTICIVLNVDANYFANKVLQVG